MNGFLLRDGTITIIHVPNSSTTAATDINNKGVIAGWFDNHAFILRNGHFTMIDAPGAFETSANAINDRGVVVGLALEPNDFDGTDVGFVRHADGTFERIVEGNSTLVADINDRGTLLVNAEQGQLLRIRGEYQPIVPCTPSDVALKVLRRRGLIGETFDPSANAFVGYVRTRKGTATYQYPGSNSTIVRGRNASGVAVGEANGPEGTIGFVFVPGK